MLFNLLLAIVFLTSIASLWYFISLKIPELVAVSDAVIVERLHEDSAKIRIFLLHFKTFYREGRHRAWFWRICGKICYRAHIFLLRADNAMMGLLQKVRAAGDAEDAVSSQEASGIRAEYWLQFRGQEEQGGENVKKTIPADAPRRPGSRIHEVRIKKSEKTPA